MKKRAIALAAGLAVALGMTGCSAEQAPAGVPQEEGTPDSLTMLVTASPSAEGLRALAAEYEKTTGISIEFVEVPTAQLPTKTILAAQSKQSTFDLAMVDGFTLPQMVQANALLDLDEYLDGDEEYDYSDFSDGLKAYAQYDGVSYAVPLSTEPYLQWYRTDLYDELGLEPAASWKDALANVEALDAAGYYGYMPLYNAAGSAHFYNEMLISSGGRLLDPESYRPLLDTDLAKDIMKQYLSLADYAPSSAMSGATADAVAGFSRLDVGQMILASGWWSTVNNPDSSPVAGKVATAATPLEKRGDFEPVGALYGWLAGISSVSPHQAAAWDFLSWALSPDNAQAFIDAGAPPPGRISTTSNPDYIEQLPYLPSVGEAVESGISMPRIPEMAQIVTVLSQTISAMASGQLDLDAGMDKAQNDLLNILVQSGRYTG